MNAEEYALHVANNTASMIKEVTTGTDGNAKALPGDVLVGVLNAQSNLAIAAALMWLASDIGGNR